MRLNSGCWFERSNNYCEAILDFSLISLLMLFPPFFNVFFVVSIFFNSPASFAIYIAHYFLRLTLHAPLITILLDFIWSFEWIQRSIMNLSLVPLLCATKYHFIIFPRASLWSSTRFNDPFMIPLSHYFSLYLSALYRTLSKTPVTEPMNSYIIHSLTINFTYYHSYGIIHSIYKYEEMIHINTLFLSLA